MIRTNRAGYVNIIDLMSNNMRTPIYQNYYISEDIVNKVIILPEKFICYPPFGCETIIASFSTSKFPPAKTEIRTFDNEEYTIIVDDLREYLRVTRGLKRIVDDEPGVLDETRLYITTMK